MIRVFCGVVLLAVLSGCTGDEPAVSDSEAPPATAHCDAVEVIPIQGEGHLVGDQEPPVPYNSTPPTSGWHTSVDVPITVAGDPLTEPEQVTVLELGGVVVSHNGLDDAQQAELEALVSESYAGQAATTDYAELGDGEVALTGWGVLQRCEALDLAAVEAFIGAYAQR